MAIGYVKGRAEVGVSAIFPYATTIRFYGEFYNQSHILTSPTSVSLQIRTPDGVINTVAATQESTGIYYYEAAVNQGFRWVYAWTGTGVLETRGEFSFNVAPTEITGYSGTSLATVGDNGKVLYSLNGIATPASDVRVIGGGTALLVGSGVRLDRGGYIAVGSGPYPKRGLVRLATDEGGINFGTGAHIDYTSGVLRLGGSDLLSPPANLAVSAWFGTAGNFVAGDSAGDYLTVSPNLIDGSASVIKTTSQFQANTTGVGLIVGSGAISAPSGLTYNVADGLGHTVKIGGATELTVTPSVIDAQDNTVQTTGQFLGSTAATGTQSAYAFQGDADTGLFRAAANQVALSVGGVEVIRGVDSSGPSLQVGVGVATATAAILIAGGRTADGMSLLNFKAQNSGGGDDLSLRRFSGGSGITYFYHRGIGNFRMATIDAADIIFDTTDTTRWKILSTGELRPAADAAYDFGSSSLRVKDGYYSSSVRVGTGTVAPQILSGQNAPESSITAPPGSLYLRTSGGSGTTLYCKITGVGNTGWHGFT